MKRLGSPTEMSVCWRGREPGSCSARVTEHLSSLNVVMKAWKTPGNSWVFSLLKGRTIWSWMLAKVDSSIVSGQTHSPAGSGDRRQPCSFFAPLNIWVSSWEALPTLGEGLFLSEPFLEMPTRLPSGVCLLVDSRPNLFSSQDELSCHVTSPSRSGFDAIMMASPM